MIDRQNEIPAYLPAGVIPRQPGNREDRETPARPLAAVFKQ
jgi:hypothetical protein